MVRLFAVLAAWALFLYGFLSNRLFDIQPWSPIGLRRFLPFVAAYLLWSLLASRYLPQRALSLTALAAMIYVIVRSGPLPLLAVTLFLLASYSTGLLLRLSGLMALLTGVAILTTLTGALAFLPINTPVVYFCIFGALSVFAWRFREPIPAPSNWTLLPGLPLLTHLAVVLKPEMSYDGLAMHLAIPSAVAHAGRFPFDHRHTSWALMPMNGDWAYTAVFMMGGGTSGGELAARLLNWTFLLLLCALVYRALLRITTEPRAAWLTALMASAPLVQLVTGSMFVENFWTLLTFAAFLALLEFRRTSDSKNALAAAVLLGTAVASKFGAIAMAIPCCVLLAAAARRNARAAIAAVALLVALAAPPYVRAYAKSGNPVFPFYNHVFKSPDFDSTVPFFDRRFTKGVHAQDLYGMTFRTPDYLEARPGGWAFQYVILVPLSLLFFRRNQPPAVRCALGVGIGFTVLSLAGQSNARYVYPAMPLFTLAAGALPLTRVFTSSLAVLTALNLAYLPASGWLHADFDVADHIAKAAPTRELIAILNRDHPGEPAAFIGNNQIAGFHGVAYTDSWHTTRFRDQLHATQSPRQAVELFNSLHLAQIVYPARIESVAHAPLRYVLANMVEVDIAAGELRLGRLEQTSKVQPFRPGAYDDADPRLYFEGPWLTDRQFSSASGGTVTYARTAGSRVLFDFEGSQFTLVYTLAPNRGFADLVLDGTPTRLDAYSLAIRWQATHSSGPLAPGRHRIELRVLGEKNAKSNDSWFDIDRIEIR